MNKIENEIFKDEDTLIQEAFMLLHNLTSNLKYGNFFLQTLIYTKAWQTLFLSVVNMIVGRRIQENKIGKVDIIEMRYP